MELAFGSPELLPPPAPFLDISYPSTIHHQHHRRGNSNPPAGDKGGQAAAAVAVPAPSKNKRKRKLRRSASLPPETRRPPGTFAMNTFEIDEGSLASHYQLLEELGSGSFGVVYKAIEKDTGEIVAIKHIDLESSEEDIQEIQGEISVLSTCSSPYVTQYKRSFLRGSKLWIVMEYLGGGSCQDLLKPGPFNESHVAIICRELLLGLDYLHREGKIHRDIKAANVLLAQSGKVKLADFGVAAQLSNIKSIRMTFVGTPFWMAPEVIQESGYDFKADIWSLGITAYEMINGAPPHAEIHPMKVLFLIPKEPAPRLRGDFYSRELKDFIACCLIKDPDQRPTAKELLRHPFIKKAGKVEGLQEVILRRQEWEASRGKPAHRKYYEETMKAMPVTAEQEDTDAWTFDTVKKAGTVAKETQYPTSRRQPSLSRASTLVSESEWPEELPEEITEEVPDEAMSDLSLDAQTLDAEPKIECVSPTTKKKKKPSVSTVRNVSGSIILHRPNSLSQQLNLSPSKRKSSLIGTAHRKPTAPDMAYGNSPSHNRPFRRVSSTSKSPPLSRNPSLNYPPGLGPPSALPNGNTQTSLFDKGTVPKLQPYNTPNATFLTRDALLGHRAFTKCVDPAVQEIHAQTGDHVRREALGRAATALADLSAVDPEGLWSLLVGAYSRLGKDPKLHDVLASQAGLNLGIPSSRPPSVNLLNNITAPPSGVLSPSSGNSAAPPGKENTPPVRNQSPAAAIKPSGPRFVLADNNPHLKSHKRRQSSFLPATHDPLGAVGVAGFGRKGGPMDHLPGEIIPGMEHTKQLADVLYGGWAQGLRQRWPQV